MVVEMGVWVVLLLLLLLLVVVVVVVFVGMEGEEGVAVTALWFVEVEFVLELC